ncbi:MAG: selenocysteine-specific translation elongation factor [Calditrichaeota bacterium]|nr:MAG: selenocysteine-specific translation elongation factor [Calditrichota bacterium]
MEESDLSTNAQQHFIIGTAGHIDHGKTALVQALTGTNTDRLKEEQARGLTIDIGFAHLGENATIIDVPGHEKFVKNMVAGVSTIDLVLFVVAADDGIMPQTREHLDILNILQVRKGIVVLTKIDTVEPDWIDLVEDDLKGLVTGTCLENAPFYRVDSLSGKGISELKSAIESTLQKLTSRHDRGVFWLPVDRSFSMKGFGTVVTGSILSGTTQTGEEVEILPGGRKSRIRGLQKHSAEVQSVRSGDRAAINIHGIAKDDISRGDVLAAPGLFKASKKIQGKVRLLKNSAPLKSNARIRFHTGTAEIMGRIRSIDGQRIEPGMSCFAQIDLEKNIAVRRLDLFVIRQYSPSFTIGGGTILDAHPAPLRRKNLQETLHQLQALEKEDPGELIQEQFLREASGVATLQDIIAKTGLSENIVTSQIAKLEKQGTLVRVSKKSLAHSMRYQQISSQIENYLQEFHSNHPMRVGFSKAELLQRMDKKLTQPFLQFCLEKMITEKKIRDTSGFIALADFQIALSAQHEQLKDRLVEQLLKSRFSPPTPEELSIKLGENIQTIASLLTLVVTEGLAIKAGDDHYFHRDMVALAHKNLIHWLKEKEHITISEFKTLVDNTSRKYALPLLNYFDTIEVTSRNGDIRYLGIGADE